MLMPYYILVRTYIQPYRSVKFSLGTLEHPSRGCTLIIFV